MIIRKIHFFIHQNFYIMKRFIFSFAIIFATCFSLFAQEEPVEATISAADIDYWVGSGEHQAILVFNWCAPELALAWGVRFSENTTMLAALMDSLSHYDNRISFDAAGGFVNDIIYDDGDAHLQVVPGNYWGFNVNGVGGANLFTDEPIANGDFVKWGDQTCCIVTDSAEYGGYYYPISFVWTTEITPVQPPQTEEPFDGIVGSAGCQAISCVDPAILGWASGCQLECGYQDIAVREARASFGSETAAIGAATTSTMECVSLGDSGVAVLTFDQPIVDGDGYDFAVFENALNHTFLELAFVEVSSDGVHFVRFPATSRTQTTTQIANGGSVDATEIHNLAGKYSVGWGTPFDLAELADSNNLDISNVTHVRIVDVVGTIEPQWASLDAHGHIINDPYPTPFESSGFDLSGVAVLNGWRPTAITNAELPLTCSIYPNPCTNYLIINEIQNQNVQLFDLFGKLILSELATESNHIIYMYDFPAGVYLLKVGERTAKVVKH